MVHTALLGLLGQFLLCGAIEVDHWVVEDQMGVRLLCKSDKKIRGCSFKTPYGKIYSDLSDGVFAERKRLQHITEEEGMDCGISISQILKKDEGDWECLMSFRVDGESVTESGKIVVAFAQAPDTVALDPPFNVASVNLTEGKKTDIKCVATYATAKPTFRWMLGDENLGVEGMTQDVKVETEEDDVFDYQQTLSFVPDLSFNNKELKCVVQHIGMEYDRTAYVNLIVHNPEEIQESSLSTEEILDDMWAEIFLMRRDMDKMKSDLDEMMDNRLDKLLRQVEDLQTTSG